MMTKLSGRGALFAMLVGGLMLSSAGCGSLVDRAINRAVDKTVDKAADTAGEEIGKKVADSIVASITPDLLPAYSMGLFRLMFYHGGYYYEAFETYEEGNYTRWRATNVEQGSMFERAFLKRNEDGSEWWRVESQSQDSEGNKQKLIMESLISKTDKLGNRRVLRMRALFPNEEAPREIPVRESDSRTWQLTNGNKLTKESLEGMTVGKESVEVPAGTFETTHIRLETGAPKTNVNWYMTDKVPGQVVKYTKIDGNRAEGEQQVWEMILTHYGSGANKSKLGTFDAGAEEKAGDEG